ncbi:MAG: hypothetical protein IJS32_09645, partial [Kiritimatiellae bacterium]|nr:hypothetical protein [Kiritimatiellia bacterium]
RPAGGFRRDGERKPFRDGERKPFREGDRRPFRRDGEKRPPAEPLHLKFSFFPDRTTLATISDNIRATGRVFSLVALAKLFLSHGNSYSVKIERLAEAEPRPGRTPPEKPAAADKPEEAPAADGAAKKPAEAPTLCQCLVCKRVFRSLPKAEAHAFSAHLEEFFDVERVETPQPATPVACVARCGMTGELLGPPNSHAYTARLHEIWKTKFPNMLWTDYLSRVQVLRDEESIEKWKEQARFRTVYRLKAEAPKKAAEKPAEKPADGAAEAAPAAAEEAPAEEAEATAPAAETREEMTRAQAEEWTRAHRRSQLLRISARCILTGAQSGEIDDPAIRNAFAREKAREERFPLTLLLALRTALKRMRLHIFKLGGKETYVSAVEPKHFSLDALADGEKRVVESILSPADGKATRRGVLAALAPGKAEDSPEAIAILGTIRKLVQAGNVLLFEDGTLKALVRAEPPKPAETPENLGKTAEKAPETAEETEKSPESAVEAAEKPAEGAENAEKPAENAEIPDETAGKAAELPAPAELCGENAALQAEIDGIVAQNTGILEKIAGIAAQTEEKTAENASEPAGNPAEGAAEPPQAEENA